MSGKSYTGGYELEFLVEPIDALKCPICYAVARDPWQHGVCGRLFCRSCLDKYVKSVKQCPYCREDNPQYFMDSKSNRDILCLMVGCVNKSYGCTWEGEVRKATEHLQLCGYKMVNCRKKCQQKVLQKDLQYHLEKVCVNRDYECPLCGEWGIYVERTTSHLEVCPNRSTPCPNEGCSEQLGYHKIDRHVLTSCEFAILECKYKAVGCEARVMRKDLANHEEDDKHHLQVALTTLAELRMRSASMDILMSSTHRQYLPKTDAKKLKSDIKQGIEKIHGKCENLQQNVAELVTKEDVNAVLLKKQENNFQQELKATKNSLKNVEVTCTHLEEQLTQIKQQQNENSTTQERKNAQYEKSVEDLCCLIIQQKDSFVKVCQRNIEFRGKFLEMKQECYERSRQIETLLTQVNLHTSQICNQREAVVCFKKVAVVAGVILIVFFLILLA